MINKGFASIIIIIIAIAVIGVGVGGYVLFSKQKSADPKMLIGLWRTESQIFPDGEYLEIKEKEFCVAWSGDSPEHFTCSRYVPYVVSGNLIGFGEQAQPSNKWEAISNELTLWQYGAKKTYERIK